MSLRALNKQLGTPGLKRQPEIKPAIAYKIISTCQERFKEGSHISPEAIALSFSTLTLILEIKSALFNFLTL